MMATFRNDKLLQTAVAVFTVTALLGFAPWHVLPRPAIWFAFVPTLCVGIPAVIALVIHTPRQTGSREPYFWLYLATGTIAWLFALAAEGWSVISTGNSFAIPAILAPRFFFYLALIMAVESLPDQPEQLHILYANRWVQWSGTIVFIISLVVYFTLPGYRAGAGSNVMLLATSLFLGLDIFLLLLFGYLGQYARSFRWQVLYYALACAMALFAFGDTLRLATDGRSGGSTVPAFAWLLNGLPILALVMVGRMKTWDSVISITDDDERLPRLQHASTLHLSWAYAFTLPVLHLFLARAGLLAAPTMSSREVVVLLGMLVLGGIGMVQSRLAERQLQYLSQKDQERISLKRHSGQLEARVKERTQRLDVTEKNLLHQIARGQALETDLRQSQDRYQVLVESMNEGIVVVDPAGLLTYVNTALIRMLGYAEADMVGQPLQNFFDEHSWIIYTEQQRRHTEGDETPFEINWLDNQQKLVPTLMSPRIIHDADGYLEGSFAVITDISELKRAQLEMQHLAHFDPLTRLPNRALFQELLLRGVQHAKRYNKALTLVLIDIDRFRRINDSLGHAVGDQLLRTVAQRLEDATDDRNTLARIAADEFAMIMPETGSPSAVAHAVERLQQQVAQAVKIDEYEINVTVSMGISTFPSDGEDPQILQKNAEAAVEHAKRQGRDNYQFYEADMNKTALHRLTLENQLRNALEQQELALFYQPKVDLSDGRIVGVEALVRWHHPELGLITPNDFIPLAEDSGLIAPLGEWVLETACKQAKAWQEEGLPTMSMSVNLSAVQFKSETLPAKVLSALAKSNLQPECLELEITESLAMEDAEVTLVVLGYLKALGVRIAIDDFGTGYSSLGYLRRFPIDALKIDRSFVVNACEAKEDRALVEAMVAMSHGMRLTVIAEGVETHGQLSMLAAMGCDQIQGFHISRPLPAKALADMIRTKYTLPL